jgi:four helix bundle protein
MGVNRFEDLRVWQLAKTFSDEIGTVIRRPVMQHDRAICTQLNASSLSTMANIAEGFIRGGRKEFAQFVRIAAASNGEARALLHAARGRHYLEKGEYDRMVEMTESIGRMLRVLERRLKEQSTQAPSTSKPQAPTPNQAPGTKP